MFSGKKAVIFDLDNTLYPHSREFSSLLDEVMAKVLIEEFGIDLSFERVLETVKESYSKYREGGEIFYREYGIDKKKFYDAYHKRAIAEAVDKIIPHEDLPEKIRQIEIAKFVFTYSSREACESILRKLGLYEAFEGHFYSVEDFGILTKNESPEVYLKLCERIGFAPTDCIFVDDSYSNLEYPKEIGMTTVRIFYNENSTGDKKYIDAAYKGVNAFLDDYLAKVG